MIKVAIHQPNYIPWLGYFYKIYQSDIFVFLDDAQYSNEGMHNWHYIKTVNGPLRLKIPVHQSFGDIISAVRTKDELGWKTKHLETIKTNYSNSRFFKSVYPMFSELIQNKYSNISEMNSKIIIEFCNQFGIKTKFINSSDLNIHTKREEKVLDIINQVGGHSYYSGNGAKAYQNEERFSQRGIELHYSTFLPFEYGQQYKEFISNISVIDFLMNCGFDWNLVVKNQKI